MPSPDGQLLGPCGLFGADCLQSNPQTRGGAGPTVSFILALSAKILISTESHEIHPGIERTVRRTSDVPRLLDKSLYSGRNGASSHSVWGQAAGNKDVDIWVGEQASHSALPISPESWHIEAATYDVAVEQSRL